MRMRIISPVMNFYWFHAIFFRDLHMCIIFAIIALQKLSNERSYKFSFILTLTEVISIRNLRFFDRQRKWCPLNAANAAEPKRHIKKLFGTDDDDRRQTTDR